jgi:hypothetical protein
VAFVDSSRNDFWEIICKFWNGFSVFSSARFVRKMDPPTQEATEKELYELFLKERSDILEEIEEFLAMVLNYFFDLEQKLGLESVVTAVEKNLISVNSLIKSLCLIHGLYGYPAEIDKPGKS